MTVPHISTREEAEPAEAARVFPEELAPGIDLLDVATVLAQKKREVIRLTLLAVGLSVLAAFLLPVYYKAETRIIPPQQPQSIAASMLGQFAPLASLAGKDLGIKNNTDIYIAILKSRTVADSLIARFNLGQVYDESRMSDVREELADHSTISAAKDGTISVAVEDRDPNRAMQVANGYVEELYRLNQQLAITEAAQRRLFFSSELKSAKDELANAEVELRKIQEKTGLIELDNQSRAIIESVAALGGQIAAKEVQLRSMQSFATEDNPDYRHTKQELEALRAQLSRLQKAPIAGNGDIMVSTGRVPSAGLEFVRRLRDVKYYEAIFEVLAKQYEIAKIDEAKNAPVIQVVDRAVPPDKKSRPKRLLVVLLGSLLGFIGAAAWILSREAFEKNMTHRENRQRIDLLRAYLFKRRDSTES
jgi:tyrosine-protein kinase Etk/Wzc